MKDAIWNVFELLVNVYEGCIIFHFVCAFLDFNIKNQKNKIIFLVGILGHVVLVTIINSLTFFEGVIGLIYPVAVFVFTLVFLDGSILKKAVASILPFACIIMVNTIVAATLTTVTDSNLESIYNSRNIYRFIMIVLVQITVTYVYQIILKITTKKSMTLKFSEWFLIFSVLGISIIAFILIHMVQIHNELSEKDTLYLLAAKAGMAIINIVCFFMVNKLSKANITESENRTLKQQNEYQKLYAANLQSQYEEIHCIRHDVKQHYNVLMTLLNNAQYLEMQKHLSAVIADNDLVDIPVDTGNDIINAVLNSKLSFARKNGIKVMSSISKDFFGIDDIDWCSLLGNLLDNAIEACCKCQSDTYIDVQIKTDNDKVDITIKNTLSSIEKDRDNNLISLKENSLKHGFGTKIIKNIIKKYNGHYDFYIEDNMFYNTMTLYRKHDI